MNSASARAAAWATLRTGVGHGGLVVRIALERDDLAAAARHRLLERRFDHRAVGIVRDQRREGALSGRGGILHDALDIGFRQEAQQIDAARGDIGVGRERDDRHVARARHLADDADRLREQRPEDDLGAFVERLLGACRAASAVPPSSLTRSWMFGALNSASAISAALRIAWPARPALPPADSGRISPTLTWPVPMRRRRAAAWRALRRRDDVGVTESCELPEQPASSVPAVASKPASARRRDGMAAGAWTGNSADTAVLLTAACAPPAYGNANLSFWRRIVNQMERIMNSAALPHMTPQSGGARLTPMSQTPPAIRPPPATAGRGATAVDGHTIEVAAARAGTAYRRDADRQSRRHHAARAGRRWPAPT